MVFVLEEKLYKERNMYRVALFGHRDLTAHREVEERLSVVLEQLIGV